MTDSRTVTTEESQRGFNTEAGLEEGKDTQYRAGVSYDTRDTTTSTTDTTVVGSGLKVGGDLGLKGTNTITVTGSDVESGGDMNIETKRLLTQAAEQGTQTTSSEMTTSTGVYATGGGDRAGWGIQSDIGKTDSESWDMTARGSTLKSGGNMTRNVEGGTITDIGTQIEAGGDFTQTADTIESLAAEDRKGSTTSSTTASMNWETGARYEGEQAYDDAVEGSSASINPRLEQGMKTTTTMTDTSESSTRAVVSTIRAGGNVNSTSTGKTTLEGTAIDAGKDVNLNAGELEFKAAEDTYTRTENVEVVGTEMKANFDTSASVGVSLGADYAEASGTEQGSNAVVGSIRSGGNTNVNTTGDATFVGTNINAGNEANISAGGDVDYQAARDTYSNSTESVQGGGEIGASVSITGTSGSVSLAGYGGDGSSSEDSSIARAGSINAGNGVNITAGNDNDLRLEGTNVAGGAGDVNLSAGRDIKLDAAESTFSSTDQETYAGAGLTVGNESKSGGGSSQSLGVEAEVDYKDNSASGSVQQGGLITGNNVNINAGRDVRAQGTGVVAENNASVSAGRDVSYQAATSTFTSDTTEVGVGLSLELSKESSGKGSAGTGSNAGTSTASAGGSSAGGGNSSGGASVDGMGGKLNVTVGSSDVTQQQGGFIVGKNVDVSAGRDIAMVGTQVGAADSASLTAGRDISLESAQSTERSDNVNVGLQGEFSAGDSSTGAVAGIDIGVDKVDNLTNQNASISGNKVTVKSGNDLTMRGANVSGNEVEADVGGDLTIESRADRTDETHVGVELYAGGFVPSSNEGGGSNNETASDGRTGSNSPKVGSSGTYSEAKGKLGEAIDTGGQISRTGAAAGLYVSDQDTVEVKQQSGITGGSSTRVNVGGSTALTGARIGSEPGGTTEFSSAGPVTMGSVAEHDRRGGIDIGFSAKPGADIGEGPITEVLPDVGTDRGDDIGARANLMPIVNTSSTVGSSIGTAATPTPGAIQGSLSPQTVTQVLTQPAVQTSVKLTKGVDGAVASFGSLAQVPDATKRSLLAQAGVPVPENVDGPTLDLMIVSGIEQGREAASAGFADSNMSPAQQANLLRTIGLGAR